MRQIHNAVNKFILTVIDFFYPWFKKIMPLQTFRYAACGGGNTVLDICISTICFNYFVNNNVHFYFPSIHLIITQPIAALLCGLCVTVPIGFYLSRYVVFQETSAKKSAQLLKYILVIMFCVVLNYGFLKFFIEVLKWKFIVSKILTTAFVVVFSYLSQRNFTFKAPVV
ncbi:MAG: GtrA family protein [Bacteroidetes bacterium]|nr:GtrA family protein [Bacteroidota bacterium]MBS1648268.1 GtrA family protein [Bacteroidota bacterium]